MILKRQHITQNIMEIHHKTGIENQIFTNIKKHNSSSYGIGKQKHRFLRN